MNVFQNAIGKLGPRLRTKKRAPAASEKIPIINRAQWKNVINLVLLLVRSAAEGEGSSYVNFLSPEIPRRRLKRLRSNTNITVYRIPLPRRVQPGDFDDFVSSR